jgi:hypothetical protein
MRGLFASERSHMTVTPTEQPQTETAAEQTNGQPPVAAAEQTREEIFRWSDWVDIGVGAEECDHKRDGRCQDRQHFHAWVRLPNPFQIRDITEKARAARARKVRELRDEESDARVVLEEQLDVLVEADREIIVDEIVDKDFAENYAKAVREVDDLDDEEYVPKDEDDDIPKLYAGIDQDREEYERQRQLPEEQRDSDYERLEKRLGDYGAAIEDEMKRLSAPKRDGLMQRPFEDLVDIIRKDRMEMTATETYLHTFNTWQWYVCTFKPKGEHTPNERVWKDIAQMKFEAPGEVVNGLRLAFESLEQRMAQSRMAKNS